MSGRVLTLILLFLLAGTAAAETIQRGKFWGGGDLDGALSQDQRWHYNFYLQSRFADNQSQFQQLIVRPSVYYKVTDNASAWLGYDYIPTVPGDQVSAFVEQRVWPQLQYRQSISDLHTLTSRSRLEIRWREGFSQIAPRFRQRVELSFNNLIKPDITFDIFDEVFLSLNNADWVAPQFVNQNRIFLGFAKPINPHVVMDIGYMNVYRPRSNVSQIDHVLVLSFGLSPDQVEISPFESI